MASIIGKVRELLGQGDVVDPGLPLDRIPLVVVDTELTGLDVKRDSVVSVGAVKMSGTRIELGRTLHRLVRPHADISRESIVVHGITPDDVAAQPPIEVAAAELLEFCGDRILAGHFFALDLAFLARESAAVRAADLRRRSVDTGGIEQWLAAQRERRIGPARREAADHTLFALAHRYGVGVGGAHNALTDAFITAQVLQRQLRALPDLGVRTLGDLLRIGQLGRL